MTTEDALALLKRMQLAYDPPRVLRGRPEAIRERLRIYEHALAPFDAETLDAAWLKAAAAHHFEQWPDCADIVTAARQIKKAAEGERRKEDWVGKAMGMVDAYVKRAMKCGQVGVKAREGGYEQELKAYLTEAAWVQAQFLVGRKDVGYSSGVLFGHDKPDDDFFRRARAQAEKGTIQVRVPHAIIERWREGAERGRSR